MLPRMATGQGRHAKEESRFPLHSLPWLLPPRAPLRRIYYKKGKERKSSREERKGKGNSERKVTIEEESAVGATAIVLVLQRKEKERCLRLPKLHTLVRYTSARQERCQLSTSGLSCFCWTIGALLLSRASLSLANRRKSTSSQPHLYLHGTHTQMHTNAQKRHTSCTTTRPRRQMHLAILSSHPPSRLFSFSFCSLYLITWSAANAASRQRFLLPSFHGPVNRGPGAPSDGHRARMERAYHDVHATLPTLPRSCSLDGAC